MILFQEYNAWYEHAWVWIILSTIASLGAYVLLFLLAKWRGHTLERRVSMYQFFAILFAVLSLLTSWMWFYYFGVISTYPAWLVALLFMLRSINDHGFTKKNKIILALVIAALLCMLYGIYWWFIA